MPFVPSCWGCHARRFVSSFVVLNRMVRLWIELFNRGGLDALITKARPERRRKVKLARVLISSNLVFSKWDQIF